MEYVLIAVLVMGFIPFILQNRKYYKITNPGLAYADKSIKNQLFILSKNMIIILFAIGIWFCKRNSTIDTCSKIIIPLKLAVALFIAIKVLPNNYISCFQFALESGVKNYKKFSSCYGRFYEILFLSISMVAIGVSILGIQIYNLATNTYNLNILEVNKILSEISMISNISNITKTQEILENLNSCAYSSLFLVIVGLVLTIGFVISNIVIYLIEWKDIKNGNKGKSGILKMNNLIFIKRLFGVCGSLFLCIDIIITYIFYNKVLDLLKNSKVISYSYIYKYSNFWYKFTNAILIIISIVIIIETLKIIIKILLSYRHMRKVIAAVKLQEKINKGKCSEQYDKYKGFDFTSKLLDYQFNVFRFMYEPELLKNKPATIKNIKNMFEYVNDLDICKMCIFMGVPLMSMNNLFLAYRCYKVQMNLCKS